ncbi:hypothetical protein FA95DRAFT_983653 [Auriscalpium vulgare]|uniref:Uncharacterized protein n=1 Tax=Auriscalpium vulgare TaxID=40419 RepID=A0ACB8R7Q7_9AGAM|nr:hypothetical protein FA95DRAFT_983653 [Auriscalpium vulgare]
MDRRRDVVEYLAQRDALEDYLANELSGRSFFSDVIGLDHGRVGGHGPIVNLPFLRQGPEIRPATAPSPTSALPSSTAIALSSSIAVRRRDSDDDDVARVMSMFSRALNELD